jgi:predicted metallo-beta-lactamase superfamily hydrolase
VALGSLDVGGGDVDISRAWKRIRENIKSSAMESLGYYQMEQHTPWFDEIAVVAESKSNNWR